MGGGAVQRSSTEHEWRMALAAAPVPRRLPWLLAGNGNATV